MEKPEYRLNLSISCIIDVNEPAASPEYNKVSSAYKEMLSSLFPRLNPIISGGARTSAASSSSAKAKSRGDKGYPCLVPQYRGKISDKE